MQPQPVVFTRSFRLCKRGHYRLCNTPSISPRPCSFAFQSGVCQRAEKAIVETIWPTQLFLHTLHRLLTVCHCERTKPDAITAESKNVCWLPRLSLHLSCNPPPPPAPLWFMVLCVHVSSSFSFLKKFGSSSAFLMWLLQWVIVFESKSDGLRWRCSWWKIWSVVREHKVFCLVFESRALTFSGFPVSILSHSDRVFPKEVLELHVTLTTLKTEVVKSFDSIFYCWPIGQS